MVFSVARHEVPRRGNPHQGLPICRKKFYEWKCIPNLDSFHWELLLTRAYLVVLVALFLEITPAIFAGHLFAYHLTVVKGCNPEQPRIIHKVTETKL